MKTLLPEHIRQTSSGVGTQIHNIFAESLSIRRSGALNRFRVQPPWRSLDSELIAEVNSAYFSQPYAFDMRFVHRSWEQIRALLGYVWHEYHVPSAHPLPSEQYLSGPEAQLVLLSLVAGFGRIWQTDGKWMYAIKTS